MLSSSPVMAQTPLERVLLGAFAAEALVNLIANLPGWSPQWVIFSSKVLLMPTLAALLYARTRGTRPALPLAFIFLSLGLCWVGDILLGLMKDSPHDLPNGLRNSQLFMAGMAAFGLGHLCYIRAFLAGVKLRHLPAGKAVAYGLPFLIYGYTMYSVVYPPMGQDHAGDRIPVLIYMIVLLSSGASSYLRKFLLDSQSATSLLVGAVLFVQSDTILAFTQFVAPLPAKNLAVMATYILGQYLIVRGCVLAAGIEAPARQSLPPPIDSRKEAPWNSSSMA
jgi:uncharacterized membrane protein YhhN